MARNDGLRLSRHDFETAKRTLSALKKGTGKETLGEHDAGEYVARIGRAIDGGKAPDTVTANIASEISGKFRISNLHAAVKTVVDLFVAAKAAATPAPAAPQAAPAPATS